jgi:hypothetical protein
MSKTRLKISVILILGLAAGGCKNCKRDDVPYPPYGAPDETMTDIRETSYSRVKYTYYCYEGSYRAVTYTSDDPCRRWEFREHTWTCTSAYCQKPHELRGWDEW